TISGAAPVVWIKNVEPLSNQRLDFHIEIVLAVTCRSTVDKDDCARWITCPIQPAANFQPVRRFPGEIFRRRHICLFEWRALPYARDALEASGRGGVSRVAYDIAGLSGFVIEPQPLGR